MFGLFIFSFTFQERGQRIEEKTRKVVAYNRLTKCHRLFDPFFSYSKIAKSTPKHDEPFYLSKTNWQSKMVDIVNIRVYNRHVYQHKKIKKCENRTYLTHRICKLFLAPPRMLMLYISGDLSFMSTLKDRFFWETYQILNVKISLL